jgi:hypothetical protein
MRIVKFEESLFTIPYLGNFTLQPRRIDAPNEFNIRVKGKNFRLIDLVSKWESYQHDELVTTISQDINYWLNIARIIGCDIPDELGTVKHYPFEGFVGDEIKINYMDAHILKKNYERITREDVIDFDRRKN